MSVRADIRGRARELLADGQWHDFEEIMRQLMKVVPPGAAVRRAEVNRLKGGTRFPQRQEQHTTERLVDIGRRAFVRESLRNGHHGEMFEIAPKGQSGRRRVKDKRYIRLSP